MKTLKTLAHLKVTLMVSMLSASTALGFGQRLPSDPPPPPPPANPPPAQAPTSAVPLWESKHAEGRQWTSHVMRSLDTLGEDLLDVIPADAATFCPNYTRLSYNQRKEFWAFLLSAMVRYESNFKPETSYKEAFNDASGKPVISRGLLQISIESSRGYACGFRNEQELHDPKLNLDCGLRILNRWLASDGRIAGKVNNGWRGGARYWSVLRSTNSPYANIVSMTKSTALCQR